MISLAWASAAGAARIMCLGDSITYGVFGTPSDAYLGYLRNRLEAGGWSAEMFNCGVGGQTSANMDELVQADLEATRPEIVLYHIGTNDITHVFPYSLTRAYILSTINKCLAYPTVRQVVLAALIPRASLRLGPRTNELAQVQRDLALSLAEGGRPVWLADQNKVFWDTFGWDSLLMADDRHPNSSGYQVMADVWANSLLDRTSPGAVTDLEGDGVGEGQVALAWTAPGDDRTTGRATSYLLRYSSAPINADNWTAATLVATLPAPAEPGSYEAFTVTGLTTGATYYFALRTRDEVGNFSDLSNLIQAVADRDHEAPVIAEFTLDGRAVAYDQYIPAQPLLEFKVTDAVGLGAMSYASGVDLTSIRIEIDGTIRTDGTYSGGYFDGFQAAAGKFSYQLRSPLSVGDHQIRIMAKDLAGNSATPLELTSLMIDSQARLSERPLSCPNPFSPDSGGVKFVYKLTAETKIDIFIFNLALEQIYMASYPAGENGGQIDLNEVTWDGRDSFGRLAPNGAYFVKITDGSRVLGTIKLAVIQ